MSAYGTQRIFPSTQPCPLSSVSGRSLGSLAAKLRGRFCPISEVCEEVANLSNLLPKFIVSILSKEAKADDDVLALKLDETYRGAGRHLLRLIEKRKDEIRRRRALKSQPINDKSGRE